MAIGSLITISRLAAGVSYENEYIGLRPEGPHVAYGLASQGPTCPSRS